MGAGLEPHCSSIKNESFINIRISASAFIGVWTQLKISAGILAQVRWDRIGLFWALTPILVCVSGRRWLGQMDLGLNLDPWHKNVIKFCLEFHGNLVMLQNQLFPEVSFSMSLTIFLKFDAIFFFQDSSKVREHWAWNPMDLAEMWAPFSSWSLLPSHFVSLIFSFFTRKIGMTIDSSSQMVAVRI